MTLTVSNDNALRTSIQQKLLDLVEDGRFYEARYDDDGSPQAVDPDTDPLVCPQSVAVNEVSSDFVPDQSFGRAVHQRRASWQFVILLGFDMEAVTSFFEQDVIAPVPRVDATDDHTYALLRLVSVQYDHPVRHGAAGGSNVLMTWEASLGR